MELRGRNESKADFLARTSKAKVEEVEVKAEVVKEKPKTKKKK